MDDAQHIIAVLNGIHNDPHGKHIVNFFKVFALNEHLTVNAIHAFYPPLNIHIRDGNLYAAADERFRFFNKLLAAVAAGSQVVFDFLIRQRVKIF